MVQSFKSFDLIQEKISQIVKNYDPQDIFVAIDIDHNLTHPKNKAGHISSILTHAPKEISLLSTKTNEEKDLLAVHAYGFEPSEIIDETSINLINFLQIEKIPLIGFTGICTSPTFNNQSIIDVRFETLANLGIDFRKNNTIENFILDSDEKYLWGSPLFDRGILYTNGIFSPQSKGDVLLTFFKKTNLKPKCVILIDDQMSYLDSLKKDCPFETTIIPFHTTASIKLDEDLCSYEEFKSFWHTKFADSQKDFLKFKQVEKSQKEENDLKAGVETLLQENLETFKVLAQNALQKTILLSTKSKKLIVKVVDTKDMEKKAGKEQVNQYFAVHTRNYATLSTTFSMPPIFCVNEKPFQRCNDTLLVFYHFSKNRVKETCDLSTEAKLKIATTLSQIHMLDSSFIPKEYLHVKFSNYLKLMDDFISNNGPYFLALKVREFLKSSHLNDFIIKIFDKVIFQDVYFNNSDLVFSHGDLKPKNVLWDDNDNFELIDWDEMLITSRAQDIVDTLSSWCVIKNRDHYYLDKALCVSFVDVCKKNCGLESLKITEADYSVSVAKWLFFLFTCELNQNWTGKQDALKMIKMLYDEKEFLLSLT